jgi:hypothetical protein
MSPFDGYICFRRQMSMELLLQRDVINVMFKWKEENFRVKFGNLYLI